jgi:hypothetical protein
MKIPKTIQLCGKTFKIVYKKNLTSERGDDLLGLADVDGCKIYLLQRTNPEKKVEVFLHECLHIIDTDKIFGLGESKVNNLTIEILSLIRNNKLNFLK